MERGKSFLAAGNFEKARIEFRNALQIVPTDAEARYQNGVVDEKLGNIREAAQFYQGAIDINADDFRARAALGRLYLFGGAPEKALDTVAPSLTKHPDDVGLLTVRAGAEIQQKNAPAALADAERALKLAPGNEDGVSVLAGIYKTDGRTDDAIALLQDAIKRNPNTVDLRLVLAQLYSSLGNQEEVETQLLELVRLKPAEKSHRMRLAQFYARTNNLDAAEKVLRDGIKALPDERELKIALVGFLAERRSREVAQQELSALVAANPKDYELKFLQAQYFEQGKDYPKATAIYTGVIAEAKLESAGITARDRLAALEIQQNQVPAAEKLIAEVLAASPRDDDALILRGNLALARKDPRAAIADLRSVLRDQPNALGVMRALARAHLANGEPALAEETMRRAVEANPKDAGARLDLAQLLAQIGKPDQAKPVIDELVKQSPDNLQALDAQFKIAFATHDLVTAKSAADAITATQPKLAAGYFYQGQVAESDKRLDEAARLYAQALDLQPEAEQPLQAITRVLVAEKRAPDAIKRLDAVSVNFPKAPIAPNLKGEVLLAMQHPADAVAAFKVAIEREPKWWVPYRNLAFAQAASQDPGGAIATLRAGIDKATSRDPLQAELTALYERQGKIDEAIAVYEGALRDNPDSEVAANNLAMLLANHRTDAQSLDRAKQLASRFSESANPSFLDTYGWVLYKRGEAEAAVAALQTAAAKSDDAPIALYHLGMAQALAGEPDAAKASLTRSVSSGKNFSGIEDAKAELDKLAKEAPAGAATPKS